MSTPSTPNDLTNGTAADADDVMENFDAITTGLNSATGFDILVMSARTPTLRISDTSADHYYQFGVSELAANRTISLPLLTGNDTFVFAAFAQTLTSKTLTSPTINGSNFTFGTGTDTNRIVLPTVTTAQRTALANVEGIAVYDTDLNALYTNDGATWTASVQATATPSVTGVTTSFQPIIKSSVHDAVADYTVLDTDGYETINMTTGAADKTITLPTAADNDGRTIKIVKVDSGAGDLILDGEGAETINGATTFTLKQQYDSLTVRCNATAWFVLGGMQNRYELKTLSADVTTNTTMSDLTFSNLITGRYYRATLHAVCSTNATDDSVAVEITHNAAIIGKAWQRGDVAGSSSHHVQVIFVAAASTLTFVTSSATANGFVEGNGTQAETYAMLEELNDYVVTTDF